MRLAPLIAIRHAVAVPLSEGERRLIRLLVASVLGDWDAVRQVRAEAGDGEPDRVWREVILMVHVFAGFPRQVEAYEVLATSGGLGDPSSDEYEAGSDQPSRGRAMFDLIYGAQADPVQARLRSRHPDFADWIMGHAYGRVLTRPGISLKFRELLAVSALLALGQNRQLASHVRGAVRCGAHADELKAVLEEIRPFLSDATQARSEAVIARFADPTKDR